MRCTPLLADQNVAATIRSMLAAGTFSHVIVVILILLALVDFSFLPATPEVAYEVVKLKSHSSLYSKCAMCGDILEGLDEIFSLAQSPFFHAKDTDRRRGGLEEFNVDGDTPKSVFSLPDICVRAASAPECVRRTKTYEEVQKNYSGLLLLEYMASPLAVPRVFRFRKLVKQEQPLFESYLVNEHHSRFGSKYKYENRRCPQCPVSEGNTMRVYGDPTHERFATDLWWLQNGMNPVHAKYCRRFCEHHLTYWQLAKIRVGAWYVDHAIREKLIDLSRTHGRTCVFVGILVLMVDVAFQSFVSQSILNRPPSSAAKKGKAKKK